MAVVTGGSRGLGRAIVRKLCACGADVVFTYAQSDVDAERTLRELDTAKGTVHATKLDIHQTDQLSALLRSVRERHGGLDVFVHNVATWTPMQAVAADVTALHKDIAVAVDPLLAVAPVLRELLPRGGRVVAVSSSGAHRVIPDYVSLGLAKAALESLVRYLAVELAGHGIAVNAVSTGKLDKGTGPTAMLAARTPAGRLTVPEDVADVVALLCTEEAGWLHGQVIMADGGLTLRA